MKNKCGGRLAPGWWLEDAGGSARTNRVGVRHCFEDAKTAVSVLDVQFRGKLAKGQANERAPPTYLGSSPARWVLNAGPLGRVTQDHTCPDYYQ